MPDAPAIQLPPQLDPDAVLARLDRVLDPELDESVLSLGFVDGVTGDAAGNVTVDLRLPTYWCAANFAYLMASDVHRELSGLTGVRAVSVRLNEHFASREVEDGAGPGKTFGQAFPDGGPDNLEQTRQIFLRKGYFTRQEHLLRGLKRAGLPFEEIAGLCIGDLRVRDPALLVRRVDGTLHLAGESRTARRYLERREELGLDCSQGSPLIADIHGRTIDAGQMETYYIRARTTRMAMEANGSLCSALLQARKSN